MKTIECFFLCSKINLFRAKIRKELKGIRLLCSIATVHIAIKALLITVNRNDLRFQFSRLVKELTG